MVPGGTAESRALPKPLPNPTNPSRTLPSNPGVPRHLVFSALLILGESLRIADRHRKSTAADRCGVRFDEPALLVAILRYARHTEFSKFVTGAIAESFFTISAFRGQLWYHVPRPRGDTHAPSWKEPSDSA